MAESPLLVSKSGCIEFNKKWHYFSLDFDLITRLPDEFINIAL